MLKFISLFHFLHEKKKAWFFFSQKKGDLLDLSEIIMQSLSSFLDAPGFVSYLIVEIYMTPNIVTGRFYIDRMETETYKSTNQINK